MTILIFIIIIIIIIFKFHHKKRISVYKLSFCFFYFNYIPRIPTLIPRVPTPIPRIPTLIPPTFSPWLPTFPPLFTARPPPLPAFILISCWYLSTLLSFQIYESYYTNKCSAKGAALRSRLSVGLELLCSLSGTEKCFTRCVNMRFLCKLMW